MTYAVCDDGVSIFFSSEGSGPPLVLHHGFGGSSADLHDFGLVDALRDRYRLILLDARGHGSSDKPHDPGAYTFERKVADVIAVLDATGIEQANYYGYSYGGLIGWALGVLAPERFASLAIGGAQPYPPAGDEMFGRFHAMIANLRAGMAHYVGWREEHGVVWPAAFRARMLANDPAALLAFLMATPDHSLDTALDRMQMPVLVVSGDKDELFAGSRARRAAQLLPNARFVEIAAADHPSLYLNPLRVAPHLVAFFEEAEARYQRCVCGPQVVQAKPS